MNSKSILLLALLVQTSAYAALPEGCSKKDLDFLGSSAPRASFLGRAIDRCAMALTPAEWKAQDWYQSLEERQIFERFVCFLPALKPWFTRSHDVDWKTEVADRVGQLSKLEKRLHEIIDPALKLSFRLKPSRLSSDLSQNEAFFLQFRFDVDAIGWRDETSFNRFANRRAAQALDFALHELQSFAHQNDLEITPSFESYDPARGTFQRSYSGTRSQRRHLAGQETWEIQVPATEKGRKFLEALTQNWLASEN